MSDDNEMDMHAREERVLLKVDALVKENVDLRAALRDVGRLIDGGAPKKFQDAWYGEWVRLAWPMPGTPGYRKDEPAPATPFMARAKVVRRIIDAALTQAKADKEFARLVGDPMGAPGASGPEEVAACNAAGDAYTDACAEVEEAADALVALNCACQGG